MIGQRARWITGVLAAMSLALWPAAGAPAAARELGSTSTQGPTGTQGPTSTQARTAASGLKIKVDSASGTVQGLATTLALPGSGGDYVRVHALGAVGVSSAAGRTLWQLPGSALIADWHLTPQAGGHTWPQNPQVPLIRQSPSPYQIALAGPDGVADLHPVAAGYLAGSRVPDVAVAETAGSGVGAHSDAPTWPFDVPGSGLHYGTFVTVFNGLTGQILYTQLDPGFVTQLAITGGELLVGDETGDPLSGPAGAWRSTTAVHALAFRPSGGGLAAHPAWTYSTGAPWAALLDLGLAGRDIVLDWSDTPQDLGAPGPPDGHVVLLGPDGTVRWDVARPGYPMLSQYDPARHLVAVADEKDPALAIGYTLAGLRLSDGATAMSVHLPHRLPTALSVSSGTTQASGSSVWFSGSVATTVGLADGEGQFNYTAGQVDAVDPGTGRVLWSDRMPPARPGSSVLAPYPAEVLSARAPDGGGEVLVAAGIAPYLNPGPDKPFTSLSTVRALSAADGHLRWQRSGGNVTAPVSVRLACAPADPCLAGVNEQEDAVSYAAATGAVLTEAPLMGDLTTAVPATIGGRRVVVAGSQSGGVYALDASDLSRVLWQANAGGAVHDIALARPTAGAPPVLVVAATSRVDVLDLDTGHLRFTRAYPGQFVWTLTVGRLGAHRAGVVVATDKLSAFDAGTGHGLWTYRPPVSAYFSTSAIVGGVTVAEYQSRVKPGGVPAAMAAVGIAATGKVAWTAPARAADTSRAMLWNGVLASPDIAGGGATGVALDWGNNNGGGRVDVRDALTGALRYSDYSANLWDLKGWVTDPKLGVIALGDGGVVIKPGRPGNIGDLTANSAATVGSPAAPVLLAGSGSLNAYPGSTRAGLNGAPAATNDTFTPSTVVPARAMRGEGEAGGDQVITLPQDLIGWQAIDYGEEGNYGYPIAASTQDGIARLTVTGTPPAPATSPGPATPRPRGTAPRPATVGPAPSRRGAGTATPQFAVEVRGHTRSGRPVLAGTAPAGYSPATIAKYLRLTGDGAGQTVAIVDAFADPDIVADVNTFSRRFGLARVCGTPGAGSGRACFRFTVGAPQGRPSPDSTWALETSLDVEWVHAIAPKAAVRLVEARNATMTRLLDAVSSAASNSAAAADPDAISLSWGTPEFSAESYYDGHCALAHTVCVASAGDGGYPGLYPAYSPDVLAIGGTTLGLRPGGQVRSEVAWAGSGGGMSYFEPKPAAQRGVTPGARRGTPDVSYDADPATGVAIYDSVPYEGYTGWFDIGGTSVGAPSWSAILAGADQLRAAAGRPRLTAAGGEAARAVYDANSAIADITSGPPNGGCPIECQAGPGYDFVTGLGSPRAGLDRVLATEP
jgi:hypothetical protein